MDGLYCHHKESDLYDENTEKVFCNIATLEKFNFWFFVRKNSNVGATLCFLRILYNMYNKIN